ncbi:MAG TPA: hypothetical protein VH595_07530 [Verrucomicrobiae bacterium]|nr:hypothetical protein [Verrucomicrobiae bacterium]
MLPPLFSGELAGHFAGFCGKATAGGRFRIVEFFVRGALLLFHNPVNVPFPEADVKRRKCWVGAGGKPARGLDKRGGKNCAGSMRNEPSACWPADYRTAPRAPKPTSRLIGQQRWFTQANKSD